MKRLENSKNPFKEDSKSYEIAQMLFENKSYEVEKSVPSVVRQTIYNIRNKLKSKGLLGESQKEVVTPPRMPEEAAQ